MLRFLTWPFHCSLKPLDHGNVGQGMVYVIGLDMSYDEALLASAIRIAVIIWCQELKEYDNRVDAGR